MWSLCLALNSLENKLHRQSIFNSTHCNTRNKVHFWLGGIRGSAFGPNFPRTTEQPCWLSTSIALQQHSPPPRRFYPTENWLISSWLTSGIVWELLYLDISRWQGKVGIVWWNFNQTKQTICNFRSFLFSSVFKSFWIWWRWWWWWWHRFCLKIA